MEKLAWTSNARSASGRGRMDRSGPRGVGTSLRQWITASRPPGRRAARAEVSTANWGQSTDVVYQFCRQSANAALLLPSHGRFVGAASMPFNEYKRKRGDRLGHNWRIPSVVGRRTVRHVLYDTNFWKSFIHARLGVAMGDPGCLSLWGQQPERHRLLAEHLAAEHRVRTAGRGRIVDEWKLRPERSDNHWFDGVVGCAVAASILGVVLPGSGMAMKPMIKARIKLSELQ